MKRKDLLPYVGLALDDTGAIRAECDAPKNARIVAWQCGFEPFAVLVWSYLPDTRLDLDEAEEIATDYLSETGWFGDDEPTAADYVL